MLKALSSSIARFFGYHATIPSQPFYFVLFHYVQHIASFRTRKKKRKVYTTSHFPRIYKSFDFFCFYPEIFKESQILSSFTHILLIFTFTYFACEAISILFFLVGILFSLLEVTFIFSSKILFNIFIYSIEDFSCQ